MAVAEKQRLGQAGAKLIEPGQTVFIDGGTTNLELVRHLALDLQATIITHSPIMAAALEPHRNVEVILIGGSLLRHSMVSIGAVAMEAISRLRADLCCIERAVPAARTRVLYRRHPFRLRWRRGGAT